ncbi:hypothetical protein NHN26_15745 [Rhodovulum tesquicola]|uniref:hypothetical protein n=1 Tax=Rhodovulum tesquicola TaxID=540254 RepID=UPI002096E0D5|nr:hypothetical protein [Rhodovulum tesquicola]MCO8146669.1 hypothetical protein [Rhodovulum tesquicola]
MSDRRSRILATLADIRSKPSTPGGQAAIARIEAGLAKMDAYAARAPRGGEGPLFPPGAGPGRATHIETQPYPEREPEED